jgi:cysteine desulfurase
VLPEVLEAMRPWFADSFGNPSSLHGHGLRARDAMAKARAQVAALIKAESPDDIIFTSDGTESANLAIKGAACANRRRGNHIVTSTIEHPSVMQSIEFLTQEGFTRTMVDVDAEGRLKPEDVRAAITDQTILIAIQHVNHDLGTIEPVREIGAIAGERGIPVYVDAEASAGWMPIDVRELGAGLLSFSPHKFSGPKGVGVLYRHKRARVSPILHGGAQEGGRRAGVENIPAIVGAGVAAEIAARDLAARAAQVATLQQRLWAGLKARVPYLKLNGPAPGRGRIGTSLNISVEFVEGEGLVLMLDMAGIAIGGNTSCVTKESKTSHVLRAIGVPEALAQGTVLLSLGRENAGEEIDQVIEAFAKAVVKLRAMSPMWDEFQRGLVQSVI